MQLVMEYYRKKSCGKKFSGRNFNIKNLVEAEKLCRNVQTCYIFDSFQ